MRLLQAPRPRLWTLCLAAALFAGAPVTAMAGPPGDQQVQGKQKNKKQNKQKGAKKKGHGKHGKLAKLCGEAGCSDAQKEKLKLATKGFRAATKSDREGIKAAHEAIKAEFAKAKPNETQLKSLFKTVQSLQANIADEKLDYMLEIHGILTPAQRAQAGKFFGGRGHGGKHK